PLQRARRTAELAGYPDPVPEPLLMEWDYGDYEGITSREIHAQDPDWDLWRDGCPGGESVEDVRGRAARFLQLLEEQPPRAVIVFSHGHFLRMLAIVFLDLPLPAGARLNLDTAAISVLRESNAVACFSSGTTPATCPDQRPSSDFPQCPRSPTASCPASAS